MTALYVFIAILVVIVVAALLARATRSKKKDLHYVDKKGVSRAHVQQEVTPQPPHEPRSQEPRSPAESKPEPDHLRT